MDFEVVVGDPWSMDVELLSELFSEWLAGGTPEEAARARLQAIRSQAAEQLRQLAVLAGDQRALVQPSLPTQEGNVGSGQSKDDESKVGDGAEDDKNKAEEKRPDNARLLAKDQEAEQKASTTAVGSAPFTATVARTSSAEAALQAWVSSGEVSSIEGTQKEGEKEPKVDIGRMAEELAAAADTWGSQPDDEYELLSLLSRDTQDHWRFFECLEHFLLQPTLLAGQALCRVPKPLAHWMLGAYYEIHGPTARELLAVRRLSGGAGRRGALDDDFAKSVGLSLKAARRHFSNLQRIYGAFEDHRSGFHHCVAAKIALWWQLPSDLANRYACLLFLFHNGFKLPPAATTDQGSNNSSNSINTMHPKHAWLTCEDFEYCALLMLSFWVQNDHAAVPPTVPTGSSSSSTTKVRRRGSQQQQQQLEGMRRSSSSTSGSSSDSSNSSNSSSGSSNSSSSTSSSSGGGGGLSGWSHGGWLRRANSSEGSTVENNNNDNFEEWRGGEREDNEDDEVIDGYGEQVDSEEEGGLHGEGIFGGSANDGGSDGSSSNGVGSHLGGGSAKLAFKLAQVALPFVEGLELDKTFAAKLRDLKSQVFGAPDKDAKLVFVLHRIKIRLLALPPRPDTPYQRNDNDNDESSALGPDVPRMFHHSPSRGPQDSSRSSSSSRGSSEGSASSSSPSGPGCSLPHALEALSLPPPSSPLMGAAPSTSVASNADSDSSTTSSVASLLEGGDRSSSGSMSLGAAALLSATEAATGTADGSAAATDGGNRDSTSRGRGISSSNSSRDRGLSGGNLGIGTSGISMTMRRVLETNGQKLREVLKALVSIGANLAQLSEYRSVFGDLTTRVVEPLIDFGFGPKDLAKFFSAVQAVLPDLLASTPAILAQAQAAETQAAQQNFNHQQQHTTAGSAHFEGAGSFTSSFSSVSSSFNAESSRSNSYFPPPEPLFSGDSWRSSSTSSSVLHHPPSFTGGGLSTSNSVSGLFGSSSTNNSIGTSPHARYHACWQRFVFVCGAFAVTLAERLQAIAAEQTRGGGRGESERGNATQWPNSPGILPLSQPPSSSSSLSRASSTPAPTPPPPSSHRRPPLYSNNQQGSWSGVPPAGAASGAANNNSSFANFTSPPPPQRPGSFMRQLSNSSEQSASYSDLGQFQSLGDSGRRGSWRTESWR